MKRSRFKLLAFAALGAGLLFAAYFLYRGMRGVDFERHAEALATLQRTRHLDAKLQQEVLAARTGLLMEYDPLVLTSRELAEASTELGDHARGFVGNEDAELERALTGLRHAEAARRQGLEAFKSHYSVLRNSVYYLPTAADRLIEKLQIEESAGARRAERDVQALVRLTLVQDLWGGRGLEERHAGHLENLRGRRSEVPEALVRELDSVLLHSATVVRERKLVQPILQSLLDTDLAVALDQVESAYMARFDQKLLTANRYRTALYVWSLLILVALILAAYKLWSTYANLERLVSERTRDLERALSELWGEMELARKIQTALLPQRTDLKGYDVAARMKPADEVGGDYYDVIESERASWVLIGDVSGHGVSAGLVMMMCQTAVRTVLEQDPEISPATLLTMVNRALTANIKSLGDNQYMTLMALRRDPDGVFHFAGLHQDLFIYRAGRGEIEELRTSGIWMGVTDEVQTKLPIRQFSLEPGDALLLYTDGATEAERDGRMLDNDGLAQLFQNLAKRPASEIVDGIFQELQAYDVHDDVSLVVLKEPEAAAPSGRVAVSAE